MAREPEELVEMRRVFGAAAFRRVAELSQGQLATALWARLAQPEL